MFLRSFFRGQRLGQKEEAKEHGDDRYRQHEQKTGQESVFLQDDTT